ncbi:MAG: beta-galactosidase [Bacteroidota bacterium]
MQESFKLIFFLLFVASNSVSAQSISNSTEGWFPFTPENDHNAGVISMNDWLDAPAGKHGFVQIKDEHLVFENGEQVKFWGTNICSRLPYVGAEDADKFAAFLAKYGVNAVRFHKFSWYAYHNNKSTEFDPEKFERFDYFQARLREKGIYYGWSHIYGHRVMPGDSSKLVAYSEIKNLDYPWSHLNGSTASLVNFAPDLQELSIQLTVNMLNHVNPHTGLRYADDPALAFIEFQNEDNIFWSAIESSLEQAPTYRAMLNRQFSQWLKKKYGNQQALEKAWGKENIPENESLEKENIFPQPSHGLFSHEYETAIQGNRTMATHILDKMRFLYETQMDFYKKFEKAIRETGYKGVLVGSCWQAGSGLAHFYNLRADYEVGMIDRHNYFGGGAGGHRLAEGPVKNESMLKSPGSGLLSTGLQQVKDRPFSFSEWMSLVPNEWTAESAPIISVYGMGLQGWDASFSFATDIPRFSRLLESERHGVYNATSPLHFGLYPVLARMIYRNDVAESPVIATRNVHIPSFKEGKLGFNELVKQGYDNKNFTGTVTPEMLAIGKFPVDFTENFEETIIPAMTDLWNKESQIITSETGELNWHYGDNPFFTVNTDATKAVVGFAQNKKVELGDWQIETENPFAVIFVTDLSKKGDLSKAEKILVTAVARGRNTGMEYEYSGNETVLTNTGEMPLLLEPVIAKIASKNLDNYEVRVLDQDGRLTQNSIPVNDGVLKIDGERDRTLYYLIIKK